MSANGAAEQESKLMMADSEKITAKGTAGLEESKLMMGIKHLVDSGLRAAPPEKLPAEQESKLMMGDSEKITAKSTAGLEESKLQMMGDSEKITATGTEGLEEIKLMMGIKHLMDSGLRAVPSVYVRAPSERPGALSLHLQSSLPVIDLAHLHEHDGGDPAARAKLIQELGCACEEWGFFQIINHGIEGDVIQRMQQAALQFFMQPVEVKMSASTKDPNTVVRYGTSFNPSKEQVREWRDILSFKQIEGIYDGLQESPDICKKEAQEYVQGVKVLGRKLYRALFESIGLEKEYIEQEVPGIPSLMMNINYYPPCPDPTLALGLSGHTDCGSLTILHPGDVHGLQVKHKGNWVPVCPVDPNALIINVADQIEILTNGKYKSIEHRVVTNEKKARMSIACFFSPVEENVVAPLPKLLVNNPLHFKTILYKDYLANFMRNRLLTDRSSLDFARI